jgi:hypothetical protein
MLERTCEAGFHARIPQVQTQRGPDGRHFYFFAEPGSLASTLGSRGGLDIDGVKAGVDIRAGYRGETKNESVGFVFAPPTILAPGRAYILLPGPAIHEAPFMPDALARAIVDGGCPCTGGEAAKAAAAQEQVPFTRAAERSSYSSYSAEGSETEATDDAAEGAEAPATAAAAGAKPPSAPRPLTPAQEVAFKREALRAVVASAKTDRVGYPDIVEIDAKAAPVFGCPAVCIKFRFAHGTFRVCPLTRIVHDSNNINVRLGVDMKHTGLPAFFVYCYSENECNPKKKTKMLALVDRASYAELGIVCTGVSRKSTPAQSFGQTIVLLGKMQQSVDRLIENPGGPWDTVTALGDVACALCTAASGFPIALDAAKEMLGQLVAASTRTEAEKEHAARGFQDATPVLDPLMTVRGLADGLPGKREQELMVIRETIVAHTDAALEANVPLAAENLLKALDTLVYVGADGAQDGYCDVEVGGNFVFYVWHRVARLSFDKWQMATEKKHEFYLFNGATYETGQKDNFVQDAFVHLKHIAEALREVPSLRIRADKLVRRIAGAGDYFIKLTHQALSLMQKPKLLATCGHISPTKFHDQLDAGPYIGFTNGVKDTERDVFMPIGQVGRNVLVSMSTTYPYVYPDDPRVAGVIAEIDVYYATLFAADAADTSDPLLRKAKIMAGSFLYQSNIAKAMHVYLGHDGNNGKSAFAEFLRLTLGDYYVTGNIGALTPGPRETLDVEIIRNCKALVCSYPEAQSSDREGHSTGLRFDSGKLKVMTGNDNVCARGHYQKPQSVRVKYKPVAMSNSMPELDHGDEPARDRVRVTRFGSKFSTTTEDRAHRIYRCIPDMESKLAEWAPFHMLQMLEWLRWFRAGGLKLEAGDEHTAGSFANRAVAAQTPEGKMRAWVEANYTRVADKANGTKLEDLYTAYTAMVPGVHARPLGRNHFARMIESVYQGVGPHRGENGTRGIYLLR